MEATSRVRTRRVHYLSGFDPRGARYYNRLYREESAKQSAHNSAKFEISHRATLARHVTHWQVQAAWENEAVSTDYQFMEWDDIVRKHWGGGIPWLLAKGFSSYLNYLAGGALGKVCAICRSAFYCALYPWGYFLAAIVLALLAGAAAQYALMNLTGDLFISLLVAIPAAAGVAALVAASAERFGITWLIRTYGFVLAWGNGKLPELQERIDAFAAHIIAEQQRNPADEVLVVGHSVGALAAVSVVAQILRKKDALEGRLHLLTLGNCIPFLSLLPKATAFREDIAVVANDARLPWTDVAVPSDPLCFFQVDPVKSCGVSCDLPNRPKQVVARIFRMFRPETYAKLRRSKIRLHFQYLMAGELPSPYDYFRITAGPEKLSLSE